MEQNAIGFEVKDRLGRPGRCLVTGESARGPHDEVVGLAFPRVAEETVILDPCHLSGSRHLLAIDEVNRPPTGLDVPLGGVRGSVRWRPGSMGAARFELATFTVSG